MAQSPIPAVPICEPSPGSPIPTGQIRHRIWESYPGSPSPAIRIWVSALGRFKPTEIWQTESGSPSGGPNSVIRILDSEPVSPILGFRFQHSEYGRLNLGVPIWSCYTLIIYLTCLESCAGVIEEGQCSVVASTLAYWYVSFGCQ